MAQFPDAFRALPLFAGAAGIAGVVANRVASGVRWCLRSVAALQLVCFYVSAVFYEPSVPALLCSASLLAPLNQRARRPPPRTPCLPQIAPVVSAGSSQSRADVLVIVMSAVLLLTGLQWLTLKPKDPPQVQLEGEQVEFRTPGLPNALLAELQW